MSIDRLSHRPAVLAKFTLFLPEVLFQPIARFDADSGRLLPPMPALTAPPVRPDGCVPPLPGGSRKSMKATAKQDFSGPQSPVFGDARYFALCMIQDCG